MNRVTIFSVPGLSDWFVEMRGRDTTVLIDNKLRSGFHIYNDTPAASIAGQLTEYMQRYGGTPETIAAGVEAIMNVDWPALFVPREQLIPAAPVLVAPKNFQPSIVDMPKTLAAMDELEAAYGKFRQTFKNESRV